MICENCSLNKTCEARSTVEQYFGKITECGMFKEGRIMIEKLKLTDVKFETSGVCGNKFYADYTKIIDKINEIIDVVNSYVYPNLGKFIRDDVKPKGGEIDTINSNDCNKNYGNSNLSEDNGISEKDKDKAWKEVSNALKNEWKEKFGFDSDFKIHADIEVHHGRCKDCKHAMQGEIMSCEKLALNYPLQMIDGSYTIATVYQTVDKDFYCKYIKLKEKGNG